ncbi:MAG: SoxR reducing system RseC family protein [Magnetospirillum sp.]|nr:SoxR reducing system RseC family protein [Magnetospirillum sp.]
MRAAVPPLAEDSLRATVEGVARVVATEGDVAWLEPEQTTSCGGCAAAGACGAKGIGTIASRLAARRFSLPNDDGLEVGERVVVGIDEQSLVRGSLTAYAIPLLTMLGAGIVADQMVGDDGAVLVAAIAGLAVGLLVARFVAARLLARGDLAPRFLRRAGVGESCHSE